MSLCSFREPQLITNKKSPQDNLLLYKAFLSCPNSPRVNDLPKLYKFIPNGGHHLTMDEQVGDWLYLITHVVMFCMIKPLNTK